jgi:hypothetical protein
MALLLGFEAMADIAGIAIMVMVSFQGAPVTNLLWAIILFQFAHQANASFQQQSEKG